MFTFLLFAAQSAPHFYALPQAASVLGPCRASVNSFRAAQSLGDGSATAYYREQTQRLEARLDPSVKDVVFEPIRSQPELLYNLDITANPVDWRNNLMSVFYHKDSVALSP